MHAAAFIDRGITTLVNWVALQGWLQFHYNFYINIRTSCTHAYLIMMYSSESRFV